MITRGCFGVRRAAGDGKARSRIEIELAPQLYTLAPGHQIEACIKFGFFANTPRAKTFRHWASNFLAHGVKRLKEGVARLEAQHTADQAHIQALEEVIAEATRLHAAGVPVEQAVEQANFGELEDWSLRESQGAVAIRRVFSSSFIQSPPASAL